MTAATKKIADDLIATLPKAECFELAEVLLTGNTDFATPEIAEAWNTEIGRRLDEYEAGRAVLHSEEEVEARVRKAINEARHQTRRRNV